MSWSIGYDRQWKRDIGYGVPAYCDHPGCMKEIDRGLSYVCGGDPHGGEYGCGLFFCGEHLFLSARRPQRCARCTANRKPFKPTPEHPTWVKWKLTDESWAQWRAENPEDVKQMRRSRRKEARVSHLAMLKIVEQQNQTLRDERDRWYGVHLEPGNKYFKKDEAS